MVESIGLTSHLHHEPTNFTGSVRAEPCRRADRPGRFQSENRSPLAAMKSEPWLFPLNQTAKLLEASYSDLEKRVQERTLDLNQALQVREEFLSIVSHELKTPITSLSLQLRFWRGKSRTKALIIQQATKQAQETRQPRRRSSRSHPHPCRQAGHLNPASCDLRRFSTNPSRLCSRWPAGRAARSQSAPLNRCSAYSTASASARSSRILCRTRSNTAKESRSSFPSSQADGCVKLIVRDQGMGIPLDKQTVIFERFERAVPHDSVSGLGLGLFISRQIVEAHGGTISVQSEPSRGSTFTVEIPNLLPQRVNSS